MKLIKKNWYKLILLTYIIIKPFSLLYAAGQDPTGCVPSGGKICNPLGTTSTVPDLIKTVLNDAIKIGIPIVTLAIIYCGFLFVFARGNSEKLTEAKRSLLWTVVGAAILLGSLALAQMIQGTVTAL